MFDSSCRMGPASSGKARSLVLPLALAALMAAGLAPRAIARPASSSAAAARAAQAFPGEEEPYAPVLPAFGKSLAPAGALAPEDAQDGATVYMNETGPFAASPPLSTDPRMLGEQLTLTANPPAPLELRSVEFAMAVQATTPLLVRVRVWDNYDAAATPVNSGLLRSEDFNLGTVPANPTGQFYPGVKVIFSSPIALSDPGIFIEFQFLTGPSGPYAPVQAVFALNTGGPQVGASTNDFFRDIAPGDGSFAPTERRQFGASSCSPNPPGCQSNLLLHLRGAPNPNVLDPGIDLWQTPGGGATRQVFTPASPIPAGLFDACGIAGRTSDPLAPTIVYAGLPLTTSPAGILGATDSIVRRNAAANIPSPGGSATIPIELVALSLVSTNPITVTWNGGTHPELWDVRADALEPPAAEPAR